jgi:hypothetical protein
MGTLNEVRLNMAFTDINAGHPVLRRISPVFSVFRTCSPFFHLSQSFLSWLYCLGRPVIAFLSGFLSWLPSYGFLDFLPWM